MNDKWQAQQKFWESFGIPAYDRNSVPTNAPYPRINYEAIGANLGVPRVVTAVLWYRSKSWADISKKADEIAKAINELPPSIEIEGGRYKVRLPQDMAFAQRYEDPQDADVRGMVLNVEMEFLTAY